MLVLPINKANYEKFVRDGQGVDIRLCSEYWATRVSNARAETLGLYPMKGRLSYGRGRAMVPITINDIRVGDHREHFGMSCEAPSFEIYFTVDAAQ